MTDKPRTWSVEKQWSGVQLAIGPDTEIHSDVKAIELEPVLDQVEEWRALTRKIGERLVNGVTVNDLSPPRVSMDDFIREYRSK